MSLSAIFTHLLSTSKHGDPHHFPQQPIPVLPVLQFKPPPVQLESSSSHPNSSLLRKETISILTAVFFHLKTVMMSPFRFLFSKLNSFSSLRHSSYQSCSLVPCQLCCFSLYTLEHLNFLVVIGSKPNTNLVFPSPVGHIISGAVQDAVGLLGHLGTLLAHIQLAVYPYVLLFWAAFQPVFSKSTWLHGIIMPQMQHPALTVVEYPMIGLISLI